MSLIPDWAPNIHPLLVHFPLSLLLVATLVDGLGAYRPARGAVRDTATWLYCAGALMAMAAYFSGLDAAEAMRVGPDAGAAVNAHFTWADRTTWFFVAFASFRMAMSYIWYSTTRWVVVLSLCVAMVGVVMLATAADHGGRLVFRHGLGVAPIPTEGTPWTIPGRPPEPTTR